jgi:hypothetical protein
VKYTHEDPDSGPGGVEFIFDETVNYRSRKFRGANPNNLTTCRWRGPVLKPDELAAALKAAKGTGPEASRAMDKILRSHHRMILKESKNHWDRRRDNDALFDDLIAVGSMGLVEAIRRFDDRRNNGFTAYALPYIRGRMQTAVKAHRRNGWSGETRLQRLVHGDHDATLERASEVMGRPVDAVELEAATAQAIGMCSEVIAYDTREPAFENEYDEESKPGIVAVAPITARSILDTLVKRHGPPESATICTVQRFLDAASAPPRHGPLEWLAEDTDRRARRRLKGMGRRAYALWLVEKDHARIAARAEPTQYRSDTPLEYRAGIASQIDRPTPHNDPRVRRCLDRSFNSEHVRRKKTKAAKGWPSVYPTWEGRASNAQAPRTMIEVETGRFVNSVSAAKLGLKPIKPREREPINPPFKMPRFATEVGGMPLLTIALLSKAALNTGDYHNDNAARR